MITTATGAKKIESTDNWRQIFDAHNDSVDAEDALAQDMAPIVNGNKSTTGAAAGEYVLVRNSSITGITDGAYTAAQAIPANTVIDSTYLTAITGGIANDLNSKIMKHSKSGTTTCDLPLNARNVVATVRYGTGGVLQVLSFVFPIGVANTTISGLTLTQGYYLNTTSYAFCQISYNSSTEKITIINLTISGTNYSSTSEISVTYEM